MVGVAEDRNVGVKVFQGMLGVGRRQRQRLGHFLVYDNIHAHAADGGIFQHSVQSVFLILGGRSSQVEFGGQPP